MNKTEAAELLIYFSENIFVKPQKRKRKQLLVHRNIVEEISSEIQSSKNITLVNKSGCIIQSFRKNAREWTVQLIEKPNKPTLILKQNKNVQCL